MLPQRLMQKQRSLIIDNCRQMIAKCIKENDLRSGALHSPIASRMLQQTSENMKSETVQRTPGTGSSFKMAPILAVSIASLSAFFSVSCIPCVEFS